MSMYKGSSNELTTLISPDNLVTIRRNYRYILTIKNSTLMKEIKVKSCDNKFLLINSFGYNENVNSNELPEEVITSAKGFSKTYFIHIGFGKYKNVEFTIKSIEKDSEGKYVYTVKSSVNINKTHFPSPYNLLRETHGVAVPEKTYLI